ncbi:glycosyltransferase family protein [Varunaivibrio sulfuroxidans]|uniref:Glycosyl transferase family 1 n=1 Tax=Varunaivibrio sulfuroxidans TaxID=1773489 RepID=A0A4R3JF36_9PROT|nr:glycosyltransferase [Varunaivibrio sulfuroxidans]TCS64729.1 glycosyl transferase family 1 [Varunaivibrio sulfuroxidans]WES29966.1 glycosyltransferase [Varunaivibrio sulfuroxidans]
MPKHKSLRFLIMPNVANAYDQRMVKGLADGLNGIGHYGAAMPTPLSSVEIIKLCENFSIDVVLQVNRIRDPDVPLPPHIRHISWYQDVYPETLDGFSESFRDFDLLYALGDPEVLGINVEVPCFVGNLFTGVDPQTLTFTPRLSEQNIDFSLCAGLPAPVTPAPSPRLDMLWFLDNLIYSFPLIGRSRLIWLLRRMFFGKYIPVDYVPLAILQVIQQVVDSFYRPLRGELNIHKLAAAMLDQAALYDDKLSAPTPKKPRLRKKRACAHILTPYVTQRSTFRAKLLRYMTGHASIQTRGGISPIAGAISYFSQSYPRLMDRVALVKLAERVSSSLELYGPGLELHEFARPYHKGVLTTQKDLLDVYARSKINLSNNTHGLGLHSRTLECMAVGGFLFMHESPHDKTVGGMLSSFEPGVHYGAYTPENFEDEARRWLHDDAGRRQVGENAKRVIQERHCWRHRAQQIVDDLAR